MRAGLPLVITAVAFAALAEQTFYALVEVPVRGTSSSELRFVTPLEAVRPWHMLVVFACVSVTLAGVGLALRRKARRAGTAVWIAGSVLSLGLMAMAAQRPRLWTIALIDQGTPVAAPWGWSGAGALICAGSALAGAVILLTPGSGALRTGGGPGAPMNAQLIAGTLLVAAIPAAGFISGRALPWWVLPVAVGVSGVAGLYLQLTPTTAVGLGSLTVGVLAVALAIGAARRHEFLLAATLAVAALLLIRAGFRTASPPPTKRRRGDCLP